jgi:hypothetical protein
MNEIYWPLLTTIAPFQKYQLFLKQPGILSGTGQDLTVPRFFEIPPHSKELDKNWQKITLTQVTHAICEWQYQNTNTTKNQL